MATSTETSPTFCNHVEEEVEEFFLIRKELGAVRQHLLLQGLKGVMNIIRSSKDVIKKRAKGALARDDFVALPEFSESMDFKAICTHVLNHLQVIGKDFKKYVFDTEFQTISSQLQKMEILIGFHGVCNVGKSTILNAFLRKQILPIDQEPETAVALNLCFCTAQSGMQASDTEDIVLMENDTFKAKGEVAIYKQLELINSASRTNPHSYGSKKYCLNMQCPFKFEIPSDSKFTLIDNPGSDEYGSDLIESILKESRAVSSAFFLILTYGNYKSKESCNLLKILHENNKGIFTQGRLTIIVNKFDEALNTSPLEKSRSRDSIKADVRKHLCEKVLHCSEDELPDKALVLVCGVWALLARKYQQSRMKEICTENQCHNTETDEPKKQQQLETYLEYIARQQLKHLKLNEMDFDTLAIMIEEESGIKNFEKRFEEVTMNSITLWKRKISEDIFQKVDLCSTCLIQEKDSLCNHISDMKVKILELTEVINEMKDLYSGIVHASNECGEGSNLWITLKNACEEDAKDENLRELCLGESLVKLNAFKVQTMDKITAGKVRQEEFRKDVKKLREDWCAAMDNCMSSRKYFKKTYEEYVTKCSEVYDGIMKVFRRAQEKLKSMPSTINIRAPQHDLPVLVGPCVDFLSATSIPEGHYDLLDLLLIALEKLLPKISDFEDSVNETSTCNETFTCEPDDEDHTCDLSQYVNIDEEYEGPMNEDAEGTLSESSKLAVENVENDNLGEIETTAEDTGSFQEGNSQNEESVSTTEYTEHQKSGTCVNGHQSTPSDLLEETRDEAFLKSCEETFDSLFPGLQKKHLFGGQHHCNPDSTEISQKRHRFKRLSQVGYKRWSQELDKVMQDLENKAEQEISDFFDNIDTNVVKIFCDHYRTKILLLLKEFDAFMKETFLKEKKKFTAMIKDLQQLEQQYQACQHHINSIKELSKKFQLATQD